MSTLPLLTREDLCALTGLKRPDAITRWLKSQGIPFIKAPDSWPRVHAVVIESLLGANGEAVASALRPRKEPVLHL
ncbi:MAG: DUF4224 domain-containing protein [Betaproteobacteria bacterium]|nr:DUF4224 domain-containing protein [Betaproteobacteria bacterium]